MKKVIVQVADEVLKKMLRLSFKLEEHSRQRVVQKKKIKEVHDFLKSL